MWCSISLFRIALLGNVRTISSHQPLIAVIIGIYVGSKAGLIPSELLNRKASMTAGLVGQSEHLILPTVPPLATMVLTLVAVLVRVH